MQREVTPVESRGGVVSGRVMLVLISSFIGAVIALGLAWALFVGPH
jgi:nitrogen fixation protein FixH